MEEERDSMGEVCMDMPPGKEVDDVIEGEARSTGDMG